MISAPARRGKMVSASVCVAAFAVLITYFKMSIFKDEANAGLQKMKCDLAIKLFRKPSISTRLSS